MLCSHLLLACYFLWVYFLSCLSIFSIYKFHGEYFHLAFISFWKCVYFIHRFELWFSWYIILGRQFYFFLRGLKIYSKSQVASIFADKKFIGSHNYLFLYHNFLYFFLFIRFFKSLWALSTHKYINFKVYFLHFFFLWCHTYTSSQLYMCGLPFYFSYL